MLSSHDNDDECAAAEEQLEEAQRPLLLPTPPPESPLGVSLFLSCLSRAFQGFPSLEEMATVASVGLNVALICRLSIFFFRSSNVSLSKTSSLLVFSHR